jgi:hypothetical protein
MSIVRNPEVTARVIDEAPRCFTCRHFWKMSPGNAGICGDKQKEREWNEGMAVVSDDDLCESYERRERR